jgi:hypothetical protein
VSEELVPLTAEQRAYQAYNYRVAGHDWTTIAERCGYKTGSEAGRAVANYISVAREEVSVDEKRKVIELELARLDALQAAVWDAALAGDTRSVDAALKVMTHRARILMLGEEQVSSNRTIIITSEEYVERLKELSDE